MIRFIGIFFMLLGFIGLDRGFSIGLVLFFLFGLFLVFSQGIFAHLMFVEREKARAKYRRR